MADHVRLLRDLTLASQGKPIASTPALGFGGSYNYGKMRIAAALEHGYIVKDIVLVNSARKMWLENEQEQLDFGHWSHGKGTEQLCPQPHSSFILNAEVVVWKGAIKRGDSVLANSCERSLGRSFALWNVFSLNGIVCAPGARAKDSNDKSNDSNTGQWRNRPADAILSIIKTGRNKLKFDDLCIQLFTQCMSMAKGSQERLLSAPIPKLKIPVNYLKINNNNNNHGYCAWYDPTPSNLSLLGKDGLTGVVHKISGAPEVYYDWAEIPNLEEYKHSGKI
jgi:hypothetical protein